MKSEIYHRKSSISHIYDLLRIFKVELILWQYFIKSTRIKVVIKYQRHHLYFSHQNIFILQCDLFTNILRAFAFSKLLYKNHIFILGHLGVAMAIKKWLPNFKISWLEKWIQVNSDDYNSTNHFQSTIWLWFEYQRLVGLYLFMIVMMKPQCLKQMSLCFWKDFKIHHADQAIWCFLTAPGKYICKHVTQKRIKPGPALKKDRGKGAS